MYKSDDYTDLDLYVNGGVCDIDDISDKLLKCLRILWSWSMFSGRDLMLCHTNISTFALLKHVNICVTNHNKNDIFGIDMIVGIFEVGLGLILDSFKLAESNS